MGKITYTKSQETAIKHQGGNLLLSAAAGSGKTATLTARILRLLLHGDENGEVNLTDMLVVTYTRAAANELRGRISSAILEAEKEWRSPTDETEPRPILSRNRFYRHITDAGRADISTIHSFLYKALKPYFPALGLPPDMSIMDESAANVLKAAAMQDTIDDFFDKDDGTATTGKAAFTELADAFGAARDAAALDAVFIDMANSLVSVGRDEKCLADYADVLELDAERGFFQSVYGEYIKEHIRMMLRHYRTVFTKIGEELFSEGSKATVAYGPDYTNILSVISDGETALEQGSYTEVRNIIANYTPVPLGKLSSKDKSTESEYFKEVRKHFKADMETLAEDYFGATEESLSLSMKRTARILRTLGDVFGAYYRSFAKRKRAQNALDYSDLELYALKLFLDENGNPTDAAKEVGARYKYIFIDEYQDTNHVQDDIFRALSENSVRFMVGDIKQSIYRFRGAEPEVFSGYRDRWPILRCTAEEAEETFSPDAGKCIFMSENFRCDDPVIRFVNMISGYMFPFGGIPYTEDDALICGKGVSDLPTPPVEICLIEKPRKRKTDGEEALPLWDDSFNPEAEYVADRIAEMIGIPLADGERPCKASDIAVITRSFKGTAEVYAEALMRRGIRVRMKANVTPLSAKSAKLVMCILNLVDNPLREIYAAGAMRSPIFGFTTDDIVVLKESSSDAPLYMAVTRAAREADPTEDFGYSIPTADPLPETEEPMESALSPALLEKCLFLARWVRRHKAAARSMKADKYIEFLYNELCLSDLPEVFGDSAELAALNRLYETARRFEKGRFGGLSGFIEYLNENADAESEEIGEENAVTIVTVHSSKGLEYPVCFLAECGKERNRADERKNLLFDPVLGFGMTLPDEGGLVRCDTAVRCGIAEKKRSDAINEEMRTLYVALTRARNKLIVTAKTPDADKLLSEAEQNKAFSTEWSVRECGTYRDLIINAAARHGADSFYETKVIPISEIHPFIPEEQGIPAEEEAPSTNQPPVEASLPDFEENFRFRYPLDFLGKIPAKLSVSALHPSILDDKENPTVLSLDFSKKSENSTTDEVSSIPVPLPDFMTEKTEAKGAERGTATHIFLQFADFGKLRDNGAERELCRLVEEKYMTRAAAELVNRTHITRFAESDLFRRMCNAEMIRREFRFNTLMPAEAFTDDPILREQLLQNGIRITVQGVVDCVFRGEKGLVLVDYKTDAMTKEEYKNPKLGKEKLIRRHKNQLMYYKEICKRLFGEEITETIIYSTTLGKEINL